METASSPNSSASPTKNTDPLLLNMYNNGHKVVAYPGIFAAKSNEAAVGAPTGSSSLMLSPTSKREKPRSMSAGRVRPSGRDLVMDVYERLGVERPDSSSSAKNGPTGTKAAAAAASAATRGRCPGLRTAAEQKRARSLSRGRVRNRWPPVRHAEPVRDSGEDEDEASSPPPPHHETTVFDEPPLSPRQQTLQQQQRSYKARAAAVYRNASGRDDQSSKESSHNYSNTSNNNTSMTTKDLMISTNKSLTDWRSSFERETAKPTNCNIHGSIQRTISTDPSDCWKDEKKESTGAEDQAEQQSTEEDCVSPTSVKERMLAFGGDSKSSSKSGTASHLRRSVDKQYAAQFAVREHPPKIDIYEAAKQQMSSSIQAVESALDDEDQKKPAATSSLEDDELMYHHGRRKQPAVESSAAAASVKSSPPPHNVVSTNINNNKGNIAEAFLAAIHTQTSPAPLSPHRTPPNHTRIHSFAPVTEVVSTDDHGSVLENVSLLSANSEDNHPQQQLSPPPRGGAKKSWNRVSAYTSSPAAAAGGGNHHSMSTSSLPIPPYAGASSQHHRTAAPNSNSSTTINEQHVERLVEERVRYRVGELERNMLDQLQTFMTRLDERMEARVARLERTVHALLANRDVQPQQQHR